MRSNITKTTLLLALIISLYVLFPIFFKKMCYYIFAGFYLVRRPSSGSNVITIHAASDCRYAIAAENSSVKIKVISFFKKALQIY